MILVCVQRLINLGDQQNPQIKKKEYHQLLLPHFHPVLDLIFQQQLQRQQQREYLYFLRLADEQGVIDHRHHYHYFCPHQYER